MVIIMYPKISFLPRLLLFASVLNLAIAPTVFAASSGTIDRATAYALGLLGMVVIGLAIYLAIVIIQPERF